MNVFVTGAAGFIGGSIATGLVRAGHKVTGWCATPNKPMN
jgi:Nucleoside-diphosphate-sugar epimerases